MSRIKDLTGQRFGRLTALVCLPKKRQGTNVFWICRCDCGNIVEIRGNHLCSGDTKSCNCLKREKAKERVISNPPAFKHGDSPNRNQARLYIIWIHIKQRCLNPKSHAYKYYGKKGVSVCDEWINDYVAFRDWALANEYASDLTIDRINHKGNYEPSNCQWLTNSENTTKSWKDRREYEQ